MIKPQKEYIRGTYTPKRQSKHWRRDYHEDMLRALYFERNKTEFIADMSYLSDRELLDSIQWFLREFNLQTFTQEELERPLSLKN